MSPPRLGEDDGFPHGRRPWVSAHLFYHADLDDLLVHLVDPLVRELSGTTAADWFYLRYWDGGPHVRLRILCADDKDRPRVEETIRCHAGRFFVSHPSRGSWNEDSYRRIAEQLARMEGLDTHAALYPDNSLRFIGYEPEFARYGTGRSISAAERHFGDSSRICLGLVRAGTSRPRRLTRAFAAILAAWSSATRDRALLTRWATHRLSNMDKPGDPPGTDLDPHYARQKTGLTAVTRRLMSGKERSASPDGDWRGSLARLHDAIAEQAGTAPHTLPRVSRPEDGSAPEETRLLPLLDLCAHLFCNRLGVPPHEERYVRYLAGRALLDVFEEDRPYE